MVNLQFAHHHRSAQRGSELGTVQAVPGGSSWVEAPGAGAQARCRIELARFPGCESRPKRFLTKFYTLKLPDIYTYIYIILHILYIYYMII